DANHETRTYAGWDSATNLPTGPTVVTRDDRVGSYSESLTMSATPDVSGGRPTGTEAISGLQTLSRSYTNNAGQLTRQDDYFNLTGVTYSTAQFIGAQNTNYNTVLTGYDDRGRRDFAQTANGTITRTVYDGKGRAISTWVGLDDTPTSGEWTPTNM